MNRHQKLALNAFLRVHRMQTDKEIERMKKDNERLRELLAMRKGATLAKFAAAIALCLVATGCASNRLVAWQDCPVTPDKQRNDYFMGYGDLIRRMDAANNAGRF